MLPDPCAERASAGFSRVILTRAQAADREGPVQLCNGRVRRGQASPSLVRACCLRMTVLQQCDRWRRFIGSSCLRGWLAKVLSRLLRIMSRLGRRPVQKKNEVGQRDRWAPAATSVRTAGTQKVACCHAVRASPEGCRGPKPMCRSATDTAWAHVLMLGQV